MFLRSNCLYELHHKKFLSEDDICTKFIPPVNEQAGWGISAQMREEVCFTNGRIIVRGKLVTRDNPNFFRMQLILNKLSPIGTASLVFHIDFMLLNQAGEGNIHWRPNATVSFERHWKSTYA
jgi:hypothetical protein